MAWRHPVDKVKISTKFGVKDALHPNGHKGVDYVAPAGTPLKAVNDGKIVLNEWSDGMGWCITLHTDGKNYWGYAHMLKQSPLKVGTVVKSGDVVGQVGNTGKFSAGAHLHLVLSRSPKAPFGIGRLFDAFKFIQDRLGK